MKKIIITLLISIFIFTGCQNMKNTPTKKVEEFLSMYQRLDNSVVEELNSVVSKDETMNEEQQEEYKKLLEKQYQNLSYKITNESIVGNKATIDVEIEVYDYETAISNSKKYYLENQDEFTKETTDSNGDILEDTTEEINEMSKYIDYKLKEMKKTTLRKKYAITFELTKENNTWQLNKINESDLKKIHGLF